jgi:hypothetical protein
MFASCTGGGGGSGVRGTSGDFVVLKTEPANNGKLFLNEPIRIDLSNPVDANTANLNTVSFAVFDLDGKALIEQPAGTFRIATSPGDSAPGRRLEFVPRFPTNDTFDNGGFRPGRTYLVQLIGGDQRRGNVLRDSAGKALARAASFRFRTADGTTPSQLFLDTKGGGPRRVAFTVTPADATGVALNLGGQAPVEVRLGFDQPLNPNSNNVPVRLSTDPTRRAGSNKGRIFLEYDDPDPKLGKNTWIPASVDLEINTLEGSEVVLRPLGVLPNNATIRCIVENTVEDMSGESNVADAAYNRIFGSFRTRASYESQFDAVIETFTDSRNVDLEAPFLEPLADVTGGTARASFAFQGQRTVLEYEPDTTEVVLNTDFTQIKPKNGPPLNVSGGVFIFDSVRIPKGTTVRGIGTRPMIWLVNKSFVVDGTLTVAGGDGARVDTLNAANFPTPGGVGVCGGGAGGRGSPSTTGESERGEAGFGPGQVPGGGGQGGKVSKGPPCNRASAGGGGAFATQGDPYFKRKAGSNNCFIQQKGIGGFGCEGGCGARAGVLEGGNPGALAFTDARVDNNFWGVGVDLNRQIRVSGELLSAIGGQGGGGGGDRYRPPDQGSNWISGEKGGGGGGGGGVLIIQCLGEITVTENGTVSANGGNGGGGEAAGSNQEGAGGGAGSGGMVVMMAGERIVLNKRGETYAQNDYVFTVTADGGVGTQGSFGGGEWNAKYPPLPDPRNYDANPSGGFGGLGVIQLMAPPGNNAVDRTNTVLDDNIVILDRNTPLEGAEKMRFLAWRGFPGDQGKFFDDSGREVTIGDAEGDLRPSPTLLPASFGHLTRLQSRWLDTGASVRRPLTAPDGAPRGIVEDPTASPPLLAGPEYFFAGTSTGATSNFKGFVDYDASPIGVSLKFPLVTLQGGAPPVIDVRSGATVDTQPAYLIELANSALGSIANRYAHYRAELVRSTGEVAGSYRILAHSDRRLFVATDSALPSVTTGLRLQIRAQFFDVSVGGQPGLGPTYDGTTGQVPQSNTRIGFAFHQDATQAKTRGIDDKRLPQEVGTFLYDINTPAAREQLRQFKARYVKWDILFNTRFSEDDPNNTNPGRKLTPTNPLPAIDNLAIPYRF